MGKRLDKDGKLKPHRRDIGIGPYPEVSLAEARAKATELRLQIRSGIDPIAHKQQQLKKLHEQQLRNKTFIECAKIVIANKTRELKNQNILGNGHLHWKLISIQRWVALSSVPLPKSTLQKLLNPFGLKK